MGNTLGRVSPVFTVKRTTSRQQSRRMRQLALVLLGSVLSLGACNRDTPRAPAGPLNTSPIIADTSCTTMQMGPAGGTLTHATGAQVVVPVGAIATERKITLCGIAPPAAAKLGGIPLAQGVEASPSGLTFLKPVQVALPFDATRLSTNADPSRVRVQMAPRGTTDFTPLQSDVDLAAGMVRVKTAHFTQFVPAENDTPVVITTPPQLPDGTVGVPYSLVLQATGGAGRPYTWSLPPSSTLPAGLLLKPAGLLLNGSVITGTPTTPSVLSFFLVARDGRGHSVEQAFGMTVLTASTDVPVLNSVTPASASSGDGDTTLAIGGSGFAPNSEVLWDGADLPSAFVDESILGATVLAANLRNPGNHTVVVRNAVPGGGNSAPFTFTVTGESPGGNGNDGGAPDGGAGGAGNADAGSSKGDSGLQGGDAGGASAWEMVRVTGLSGCGVQTSGVPYCWGDDSYGQFGPNVPPGTYLSPVAIAAAGAFSQFAFGGSGACALDSLGAPSCWGVDDAWRASVPSGVAFTTISVGSPTCGLDGSGSAWCWGSNQFGALGVGSTDESIRSGKVSGGPYKMVSTGGNLACAIDTTGMGYCWGFHASFDLSSGGPVAVAKSVSTPTPVTNFPFAKISAGQENACGVSTMGTGYCWGSDWMSGALGKGTPGDYWPPAIPIQMPAGVQLTDIANGANSSCGLTTTGSVYCWGSNHLGTLGRGTVDPTGTTAYPVPEIVPGLPPIKSITVGGGTACALAMSGARYCWGSNTSGKLGDGTETDRPSPVLIP